MDGEMGGNIESWNQGKISGAVYRMSTSQKRKHKLTISPDEGEELQNIIIAALSWYYLSNPLHPEILPAVRKMEAEIVAMVLKLYHAPEGAAGTMTSGGTESIINRKGSSWLGEDSEGNKRTRNVRTRVSLPTTRTDLSRIIPSTAHAAFDKGGQYLVFTVHSIPIHQSTRQVDIRRVARAM